MQNFESLSSEKHHVSRCGAQWWTTGLISTGLSSPHFRKRLVSSGALWRAALIEVEWCNIWSKLVALRGALTEAIVPFIWLVLGIPRMLFQFECTTTRASVWTHFYIDALTENSFPGAINMVLSSVASSSKKRKNVFVEGGFDSEEEEEINVDIGMTVNKQGYATSSRHLHVETTATSKHITSLPPLHSQRTDAPKQPEVSVLPEEKRKRKQVCRWIAIILYSLTGNTGL